MTNLTRWLLWDEGQTFERKSCYDKSTTPPTRLNVKEVARQIGETLCAMANADGGTLFVGQEDLVIGQEATTGEVTGAEYGSESLELLRTAPQRLVHPPVLPVDLQEGFVEGKRVFVFQINSSPTAHRLTDGRCLLRLNKANVPYSEHSIAELKKNQSPYERRPVPGATLTDLDPDALSWFAAQIGSTKDHAELLTDYGLFDGTHLTRAAVLLFARQPLRWQDHTDITIVRYQGKERGLGPNYQASKPRRLEAPLVRLIENGYTALGELLERHVGLRDLFFAEEMEYPAFAWQEAIVNAVAHRDYVLLGLGIEIWLFDDRLEVRSPGTPLVPIESLQSGSGVHYSRNPLMARVLIDAGYMREQGEGIPRMFQAMEAADLQPPQFDLQDTRFVVTLRNTPVYDAETRVWLRRFKAFGLARDQRRLLAFARTRGMRFTNNEVQKLFGLDPYAARNLIRSLIRKKVVRLLEPRGRQYEIITDPFQEPVPQDLIILLPLFTQEDVLPNRVLRQYWNLSPTSTLERVRHLVDAGWLEPFGAGRMAGYRLTDQARNRTGLSANQAGLNQREP